MLQEETTKGRFAPSPDSSLLLHLLTGDGVLGALQRRAQAEGLPQRLLRRDQDLLREIGGEYPVGEAVGPPGGSALTAQRAASARAAIL